jgi:single-stranded-DNA-specific exonuclease
MSPAPWVLPPLEPATAAVAETLTRELNVPPFVGKLLARRGFRSVGAARDFLYPKLTLLSDPFQLPNMHAAVERILRAIDARERIVLYGDYDVDGVTSLTILSGLLSAYGADPACFLPMRIEEGYGLSAEGVARCIQTHSPRLLIAVDCGTSSTKEIRALQASGVDVVVFDHHEPPAELPPCVALVNPKMGDGYHYLCTAGLMFKACHALLKRRPLPGFDLRDSLDLVALGTVADLVPLAEENRILVRRGTLEMARTRRPGLRALMEVSAVKAPVRPCDIGFRLGPRLNAAGRLGAAQAALELLQTTDESRARELAAALDAQNRERQAVEQRTLVEAQAQLAAMKEECCVERTAAIVVGARGWHPGVLGIVASRLMRYHHRPTLVIGFDERGLGKGSGRSIEGLSLVGALNRCAELLDKFGGHEMAAGLTLQESAFAKFQKSFCGVARELLSDEQLQACLRLDAEITLAELDADFLSCHEVLQPFGMGNPQPVFLARRVVPINEPRVLKDKHLSFLLKQLSDDNRRAGRYALATRAIFFGGAAHQPLPPPPWDIAFQVEANDYRGETTLQVQVQALRAAMA